MIIPIITFLWVAGFILVLWRLSLMIFAFGNFSFFFPFFAYAFVMQITAAIFYYEGMQTTDSWIIFKFLWLGCFVWIFISLMRFLKDERLR